MSHTAAFRGARRGFTLIELLVVIAIIAILAAILFPVFAQAREKARQTACLSNEKQLALAVLQYTQDYDETYPIGNDLWNATGWTGSSGTGRYNWSVSILPYVKSNGVFACPDDSQGNTVDPTQTYNGLRESYAANGLQNIWSPGGQNCLGLMCVGSSNQVITQGGVTSPAAVIMLAEVWSSNLTAAGQNANFTAGWNNVVTGIPYWLSMATPNQCGVSGGTAGACGAYPNGINGAVSVHSNGLSNFAFADGHVKALHPTATVPNPTVSSGSWWTDGEYDTGANDNKPSMWLASHV